MRVEIFVIVVVVVVVVTVWFGDTWIASEKDNKERRRKNVA